MAVTRINNNQITDAANGNVLVGINAGTKLQPFSITATRIANNLTYGSDLTITGNLTVSGTTTNVDTVNTLIQDPLITLADGQTSGAPTLDIGTIGLRGSQNSAVLAWKESALEFVTALSNTTVSNTTFNINSYANLHTGNFTVQGTTSLIGNIIGAVNATDTITGGNLATPGTASAGGNITGANLLTGGLISATATITGGNVLTGGLVSATGNINSAANITGANVLTGGLISATGNIDSAANITGANLLTGGLISATATITGGNLATGGTASAGGNITGANLLTGGLISATGNIDSAANITGANLLTGGLISATGSLTGGNIFTAGNVSATGNVTSGNVIAGNAIIGNISLSGDITVANINATGYTSVTGNVTGGNVLTGGLISATGNINSAANITGANVLTGGLISATATITGGNLATGGTASATGTGTFGNVATGGTASATGTITGGNVLTGGLVSATGNINSAANITGANVLTGGSVSATSNVTGGNLVSATVTNPTAMTVSTNVGDINLSPAGNIVLNTTYINGLQLTPVQDADAASKYYVDTIATTGITIHEAVFAATISNLATATGGAITYAQPNGAANGVGATLTTTGSYTVIDTANVQTVGTRILVKDQGNAVQNGVYVYSNATVITRSTDTDQYGADSAESFSINDYFFTTSGNVNAGTAFVVSAPPGVITFGTSNIEFGIFSQSQVYSANTQAGLILNGTVFSAKVDNNTTAFDGGGNISVKVSANLTTPNIGAATGTSLSTTGTITGGNLETGGTASVGGNITGANLLTGGLISATATITGGNLATGGTASAGGNITGANLLTGGLVSATGNIDSAANITGANLLTGGLISATATITGGNLATGGTASVGGNITGANVLTGGLISATATITGGNLATGGTASATGTGTFGNVATGGTASATGNITGGNILSGGLGSFTGNVTAANFIGNIVGNVDAAGSNTQVQFNDTGDILGASAGFTFDKTANLLTVGGNIGAVNFNGNVFGTSVSASGTVTAASTVGGVITGTSASVTGTVTAASTVGGVITGSNVSVTGNITSANLILTTGIVDGPAAGLVTVNGSGIDTDFAVNGDTLANVFYVDAGTGTASFGSSTQTTNAIVAFNTTNSILLPAGNLVQRPATGVTGMMRFNSTTNSLEIYNNVNWTSVGATVFTVITDEQFNGDGVATQFTLANSSTTASTIVSINGVLQIPTSAYSVSNVTLTFTEAPASADLIDVRALTTTASVLSIRNVSSNAVVSVDDTSATVAITGDLTVTGNATVLGAVATDQIINGSTRVEIPDPNQDIHFDVNGANAVALIGQFATTFAGNVLPAANVTYDLGTTTSRWKDLYLANSTIYLGNAQISANATAIVMTNPAGGQTVLAGTGGNVSGGNITTGGLISATGNITGGNVLTGGLISVTATITGGNIATGGTASATGNVTGGNVLTGGLISATGNVSGGNLNVTGNIVNTGALTIITGSNGNISLTPNGTGNINTGANIMPTANATSNIGSATLSYNTIFAKATSAQYADLAEKYTADAEYAAGTVVVFGGTAEVTVNAVAGDTKVAGVVSTNPSYTMNSGLQAEHVATVALTGRVPTLVVGPVRKGDLMVAAGLGRAQSAVDPKVGSVIGKALEDFDGAEGTIEVVVGRF